MESTNLEDLERAEAVEYEKLQKADHTKRLFENPLLKEALQKAKDEALREFREADPTNHLQLMAAQQSYEAIERIAEKLVDFIEDGEMAKKQIPWIQEQIQNLKKRLAA